MISAAAAEDRPLFLELMARYLEEVGELGSDILASPRTMAFFGEIFDHYLAGELGGVCLLALVEGQRVGFTLAGELGELPWDTVAARQAIGWGTWVAPRHRRKSLAKALRREMLAGLEALGFDSVLGSAFTRDQLAATGRQPHSYQVLERLGVAS